MSNVLYRKDLTQVQCKKIKFLFEKTRKVGRPSLNSKTVLNTIFLFAQLEQHSSQGTPMDLVERFFQRIKNYRHIAFRFDKLMSCFLNFVLLAYASIHC